MLRWASSVAITSTVSIGTAGLSVQVVGKPVAGGQGELADRHALRGVDVGIRHVAHLPASRREQRVDGLAGSGFGGSHGRCATRSRVGRLAPVG